jgi:hypothetical protein
VPEGISEDAINLDDFIPLEKRTRLVRYIDTFISAPEINAGDNFFSAIRFSFTNTSALINDILFDSTTSGTLSNKDTAGGNKTLHVDFSWEKSADETIFLETPGGTLFSFKFIREIPGGYSVLTTIESSDREEKAYVVHDFVKDSGFEITNDMFPGRYQIDSNDGFSNIRVSFAADGTVRFQNVDGLGGYWFINEEGNLISFECTDLFDVVINDYATCLDSFNLIGTSSRYTQISHIRELKFLHRDGDDFHVKYNASFWGEVLGVVGPNYITPAWTYRMRRIGDIQDNGSN